MRPPALLQEEKARIVLSILAGEIAVAEAAQRAKMSEQSVGNGSVSSRTPAGRGWRRHQARARRRAGPRGPWPRAARERMRDTARRRALAHPAWGRRTVQAMRRHDGHPLSQATVPRLLRHERLLFKANYQREHRQHAARPTTTFAKEPTGPNQVWQPDFTQFATGVDWHRATASALNSSE